MSYTKKDIQEKFNVSQATVENWIKTGTLSPPSNGKYSDKIFYSIVKKIESEKLKSRANRTYSKSSGTVYLGIKKKERKELL
ncbi:MAG: restriction endonuclease, partial [Treponema sp.]|nr:restriction endonuclease [Treponema sp.]